MSCSSGCTNRQNGKSNVNQQKKIRPQERRNGELRPKAVLRPHIGKANSSIKGNTASRARSRPPPRTQQTAEEVEDRQRAELLKATRQRRAQIEDQTCPRLQQMVAICQREVA